MFRRLFFLISIFLVLGLVGNASAGLVGRWTFNDGDANDSSGNGHDGTLLQGSPGTSVGFVYDAVRDSNVLDCNNPYPGNDNWTNSVVDCGSGSWVDDIQNAITCAGWTKVRTIHTTCYLLTKGGPYQMRGDPDGRFRVWLDFYGSSAWSTSSLLDDKWHHVAFTWDSVSETRIVYFDGVIENVDAPGVGPLATHTGTLVIGGRLQSGFYHRGWNGLVDDLQLYDNAISYAEVRKLAENYKAYDPVPTDGVVNQVLFLASIGWKPGVKAGATAGHKVYLGTSEALVEANDVSVYKGTVDSNTYSGSPIGALVAGVDYYWKVNAVNGVEEWPGDVWSFSTVSLKASEPNPIDTSKYISTSRAKVTWKTGYEATRDAVYFGTSKALIDASDPSVYKGDFWVTSDPNWPISPDLVADETYYWRIDVNFPSFKKNTGNVWSFTTSTVVADVNFLGWWKFDEKGSNVVWDATGREHYGTFIQGAANTSIDIVYDADMDSNVLDINNPPGHTDNSVVDAGGNALDVHDPGWADIQSAVTVAGWTKLEEMHTTNYLLTKGGRYQLTSVANDPDTGASDGRIRGYIDDGVFADSDTYSVSEVNDSQWHHLAFTYDSGTLQRIIYIDGDREYAETVTEVVVVGGTVFPLLRVHTSTLVIGGRIQPGYNFRGWNGRIDDVRLYDRALSREEIHEIGVTDANKAWGPYPQTAADPVPDWPLQLHWIPGDNVQGTLGHKVYFGTDRDLVEANDVSVYLGTYTPNDAPAPMGSMRFGGTYYWKVNELNGATEWPGKVWWFRMGEYKSWEDFESYNLAMNLISGTWELVAWTGGAINLGMSSNNEPVNGGERSMKYEYDNQSGGSYYHSEAYRDFGSSQDWSYATGGVKSLRLYFYGETGNDPDDMYVVLDDGTNEAMKLYDSDLSDVNAGKWKEWDIDLSWFTDGANHVNLASVQTIYIGFGERGNEEWPTTHLAGTVYFDDFRVYPPHCVSNRLKPDGDVTGNCIVNNVDIRWMNYRWLENDYTITPSNPGTANLIGYWNFDDGTANDSSPGGLHDGTLVQGDVATSVAIVDDAYRGNKVLELNNPTAVLNSVVDCNGNPNDISDPNWSSIKEQISIAAWFKADTLFQDNQYLLTRGSSYQVRRYVANDEMAGYMDGLTTGGSGNATLETDTLYSGTDIVDDDWHHIAVTYDSIAEERKVYIDGRIAGTDKPTGQLALEYYQGFVIGGRLGSLDTRGWDGRIDEVRLYNDVLTQAEVVYLITNSTSPEYFEVWSLGNLTDTGDSVNSRFVNLKDYNKVADTWLDELLWPSGW